MLTLLVTLLAFPASHATTWTVADPQTPTFSAQIMLKGLAKVDANVSRSSVSGIQFSTTGPVDGTSTSTQNSSVYTFTVNRTACGGPIRKVPNCTLPVISVAYGPGYCVRSVAPKPKNFKLVLTRCTSAPTPQAKTTGTTTNKPPTKATPPPTRSFDVSTSTSATARPDPSIEVNNLMKQIYGQDFTKPVSFTRDPQNTPPPANVRATTTTTTATTTNPSDAIGSLFEAIYAPLFSQLAAVANSTDTSAIASAARSGARATRNATTAATATVPAELENITKMMEEIYMPFISQLAAAANATTAKMNGSVVETLSALGTNMERNATPSLAHLRDLSENVSTLVEEIQMAFFSQFANATKSGAKPTKTNATARGATTATTMEPNVTDVLNAMLPFFSQLAAAANSTAVNAEAMGKDHSPPTRAATEATMANLTGFLEAVYVPLFSQIAAAANASAASINTAVASAAANGGKGGKAGARGIAGAKNMTTTGIEAGADFLGALFSQIIPQQVQPRQQQQQPRPATGTPPRPAQQQQAAQQQAMNWLQLISQQPEPLEEEEEAEDPELERQIKALDARAEAVSQELERNPSSPTALAQLQDIQQQYLQLQQVQLQKLQQQLQQIG